MNRTVLKKIITITAALFLAGCSALFLINYLLNRYSIPDKEERVHNLRVYSGITDLTQLDAADISNDIDAALQRYTNWDNLFLSEHFKKKYKNRNNILDDVGSIANIHSGLDYENGDYVVIIFADKKHSIFDTDESDDITTEYYFKYVLNDAGEIDDLILLRKQDVYTINGEPVDDNE
jgi:hypothetical protein